MINVSITEQGEYMAFGLSKNDTKSQMNNADAIVAFTDKHKRGHAVDYFLGSKEQVRNMTHCSKVCMVIIKIAGWYEMN